MPKLYRSKLDPFREEIIEFLKMGLSYIAITRLINRKLTKKVTYQTVRYFCIRHFPRLVEKKKNGEFS